MKLHYIWEFLQKLLFPSTCINCGITPDWLCDNCIQRLSKPHAPECPICRKVQRNNSPCINCTKNTTITELYYLFIYGKVIRKLIKLMKYKRYFSIKYVLAKELLKKVDAIIGAKVSKTSFTFAPSTKSSLKKRGFNQAQEILKTMHQMKNKITIQEVFIKSGKKRQALLTDQERRENIKGTISLQKSFRLDKKTTTLVIIDDIATTGSTLNECSSIFHASYPNIKIVCLVVARPRLKSKKFPP